MDCFQIKKNNVLIRMFNALPVGEPVDIYMDGHLIVSNLKYKDFSPYTYISTESHKVDVYKAGTKSNPLIRTSLFLPLEQIFTLGLTGNKGEETLLTIPDDIEQMPSSNSAVGRIINLAPNIPIADVFFNNKPEVNNIDYRDQTPYAYIPPGKYTLEVKATEDGSPITKSVFDFKADRIYTTYIVGDQPNTQLLNSVDGNTYVCKAK